MEETIHQISLFIPHNWIYKMEITSDYSAEITSDGTRSVEDWEKFKINIKNHYKNHDCHFVLSQNNEQGSFISINLSPKKEGLFVPIRKTEGWISQLLNQPDVKGLDIRKTDDGKIEIYELGEPSQYPGKYVGRFRHNSPNVERYERYKDYFRYPIQLSAQSIIMIHHFSDRDNALDQVFEEQDMVEENDAALKHHYSTWDLAAKQFFHQLEGHYSDAFLHSLIVEAAKRLAVSDKRRLEMSMKHERTCKDGGCNHAFENRTEEALKAAAEETKNVTSDED